MADRFAVGIGAGKTWTSSDTSIWSASTGGASGASVPGLGDVAVFDANSGGSGAYAVSLNYDPTCDINFAGISAAVQLLIRSSVRGTQRTITASAVTVADYVQFQDIVGAGAGSWDISGVQSGDAGGNSGITFATPATNYWIGSAGNWSDVAEWASSSGGASSSGRVPLPQDTARIDANSGTGTITQNMPRFGSVDFTGSSGITWSTGTTSSFFGSINLTDLGTRSGVNTTTYEGRGSSTVTSTGKTLCYNLTVDAPGGSLVMSDAVLLVNNPTVTRGTFTTDFNVTLGGQCVISGTGTRTVNMGSGTWTHTGDTANWWLATTTTNLTFDAGTSTIRAAGAITAARAFVGGGLTYYRLENATTGAFALQITGSNTFTDGIYVDGSAAARTIQFTAGTTTTVGNLTRDAGTNVITIGSSTAAAHTLAKSGGGVVSGLDYMNISYSTASPSSTFYAGANSTDSGNNTNWTFSAYTATTTSTPTVLAWVRSNASAVAELPTGTTPTVWSWVRSNATVSAGVSSTPTVLSWVINSQRVNEEVDFGVELASFTSPSATKVLTSPTVTVVSLRSV